MGLARRPALGARGVQRDPGGGRGGGDAGPQLGEVAVGLGFEFGRLNSPLRSPHEADGHKGPGKPQKRQRGPQRLVLSVAARVIAWCVGQPDFVGGGLVVVALPSVRSHSWWRVPRGIFVWKTGVPKMVSWKLRVPVRSTPP